MHIEIFPFSGGLAYGGAGWMEWQKYAQAGHTNFRGANLNGKLTKQSRSYFPTFYKVPSIIFSSSLVLKCVAPQNV